MGAAMASTKWEEGDTTALAAQDRTTHDVQHDHAIRYNKLTGPSIKKFDGKITTADGFH
jgi:hypothetical protein